MRHPETRFPETRYDHPITFGKSRSFELTKFTYRNKGPKSLCRSTSFAGHGTLFQVESRTSTRSHDQLLPLNQWSSCLQRKKKTLPLKSHQRVEGVSFIFGLASCQSSSTLPLTQHSISRSTAAKQRKHGHCTSTHTNGSGKVWQRSPKKNKRKKKRTDHLHSLGGHSD